MIPDPVRLESADELAVKLQPVNIEAANPSGGLTACYWCDRALTSGSDGATGGWLALRACKPRC